LSDDEPGMGEDGGTHGGGGSSGFSSPNGAHHGQFGMGGRKKKTRTVFSRHQVNLRCNNINKIIIKYFNKFKIILTKY
jgi:hypothetical protein